jgi:hypothetical protein
MAGGPDDASRLADIRPLRQGDYDGGARLAQGTYLVVEDVVAARAELIAKGAT